MGSSSKGAPKSAIHTISSWARLFGSIRQVQDKCQLLLLVSQVQCAHNHRRPTPAARKYCLLVALKSAASWVQVVLRLSFSRHGGRSQIERACSHSYQELGTQVRCSKSFTVMYDRCGFNGPKKGQSDCHPPQTCALHLSTLHT